MPKKMLLDTEVTLDNGLKQTDFELRDIHFGDTEMIVHTLQGNVIPLPLTAFASFLDSVRAAVKTRIVTPPVPVPNPK